MSKARIRRRLLVGRRYDVRTWKLSEGSRGLWSVGRLAVRVPYRRQWFPGDEVGWP